MNELYRQRSEDGVLRFEVFRQLGGIEGALGVRAEEIFAGLPGEQQAALPHVLSLLVSVGEEQNAVTARRAAWASVRSDTERELVNALVEARLFVSEFTGDVPTFGVAHEALLRRWPRVVEWVERHREALQVRTRIGPQSERWAVCGKPRDLLLPEGTQLSQANSLLNLPGLTLSSIEVDFIQTSHGRARSFKRLRAALLSALAALAVIAIVLGLTARAAQSTAERHRSAAEGLMTSMLSEFVGKLRPLGRLDLLDSVSKQAFVYLAHSGSADVDETVLSQRARALQVIAEVHIARADPANARSALQAARTVLTELDGKKAKDKSFLLDLGANAFWLGQIAFEQGELDEARRYMTEYLRIADRLVALDSKDPKGWIEQSYAHSSLGSIALSLGTLDAARIHFQESIRLKEAALDNTPSDDALKADLADSLSWLASTDAKLGKLRSALQLYRREESLLHPLHNRERSNALWSYRLAMSAWHSADMSAALGDLVAAKFDYRKAKELMDSAIASDPTNRAWQLDHLKLKQREIAIDPATLQGSTTLMKLLSIERELMTFNASASPNIELAKMLALARQQRGEQYLRMNRLGEADAATQQALAPLVGFPNKQREDLQFAGTLANIMLTRAKVLYALHDKAGAHALCREVQQMLSPAAALTADYTILVPLSRSFSCTEDIQKAAEVSQRLEASGYADPRTTLLNFHP
ncbi:hypothetical protein GO485_04450 [Pseudoduganella flava]|uniref:Novel STAND NTPase 1 domain-containing protein n=1 Tax=Pseudoduganella flava TaxID=871742 RepID=A0ABX6FLC5_9BURK|nr:hypothetical protein [Pseudoduganella flava]QGZ38375.1 hypothetical protein GO485_04450 [Pseudoduganella flava]